MQDVIDSMNMAMELRGFAKSTRRTYTVHLLRFSNYCGKHPASASYDDVRVFHHHAITARKLSSAYVNSAYGAIKFYFQSVLCRQWNMLHVPRVKKMHSLPTVLSMLEVHRILDVTVNLKHKAMLSTIYSNLPIGSSPGSPPKKPLQSVRFRKCLRNPFMPPVSRKIHRCIPCAIVLLRIC